MTPKKRGNSFINETRIEFSEGNNDWTDRLQIQRALPGLIRSGSGSNGDLAAEIAELREMVKQLRKEMKDK